MSPPRLGTPGGVLLRRSCPVLLQKTRESGWPSLPCSGALAWYRAEPALISPVTVSLSNLLEHSDSGSGWIQEFLKEGSAPPDRQPQHSVSPFIPYARRRGAVYWRQDFSRENVCEIRASPGQGTMQICTELRKKLGLGTQGVAVAWQRECGIMRSGDGLVVVWDPPRNHVRMRIPILEFLSSR